MKKQRSKVEGEPIKKITVSLNSERWKKLEEIMVKCGAGKVKDGEVLSEKLRECIDKLHYHYVVIDKSKVSLYRPEFKPKFLTNPRHICPMELDPESEDAVITAAKCQSCHDRAYDVWKKCSAK